MRLKVIVASVACLVAAACATPDPDRAGGQVRDAANQAARATSDAFARAGNEFDNALASLETPEDGLVADPFEPFNRAMYSLNSGLDRAILGPVASGYETVAPQVVRNRVRDFLDNWKAPVWFANDVLQGDINHAGVTASRFALNTTVGGLGFYDFAAHHVDLPKRDEDFGQTLGTWGVGNGAYLMLPLLGPTTFRDLAGTVVDTAIDPFTWAQFEGDDTYRIATRTLDLVDIRVQTDPVIDTIRQSVDPYAQARALYIQNRTERLRNGQGTYEDLPDFD